MTMIPSIGGKYFPQTKAKEGKIKFKLILYFLFVVELHCSVTDLRLDFVLFTGVSFLWWVEEWRHLLDKYWTTAQTWLGPGAWGLGMWGFNRLSRWFCDTPKSGSQSVGRPYLIWLWNSWISNPYAFRALSISGINSSDLCVCVCLM